MIIITLKVYHNIFAGQGSKKYEQPNYKEIKNLIHFPNWEKSITKKFRIYSFISKCNDRFTC